MAGFAAAPAAIAPPVVRQGRKLIIPVPAPGQAAALPQLCVKCGAPADGKPVVKTFYWHNPAFYLIILAGVLIYVIVAMIVRKSIRVSVPLCAQHAQRRSIAVTLAWVLPLIGIADIFVLNQFNIDGGIIALLTTAFILAGIVIWAVVGNPIRPTLVDSSHGEFTGLSATFLEHVPDAALPRLAVTQQLAVPPPPTR